MEAGGKDSGLPKLPNEREEYGPKAIRRKMIQVEEAAFGFAHDSSPDHHPKQYLPDKPIIHLKNGLDLIAVQTLRADDLYVPRDPQDNPDNPNYMYGFDLIKVPSSFIQEGSYVALFIPTVWEDGEGGNLINKGRYDITVIRYQDSKRALKLMGLEEESLTNPPLDDDFLRPFTTIPINKGNVTAWKGRRMRTWRLPDNAENTYKKTVNGTVCYRMVEGKVAKEKSRNPARSFVPDPVKSSI